MMKEKDVEEIIKAMEREEQNRLRRNAELLRQGVRFVDWKTAYIEEGVVIGEGTLVGPCVTIAGKTTIGRNCFIGQGSYLENAIIADDVDIRCSFIIESEVGSRTKVGPFAYMRPNSVVGEDAKIGDFVEIKNSSFGNGSKASHLTYIGDADVGDHVNLGCGVVFVNYNGSEKFRSTVGSDSFIGCNSNLVSPVEIGRGVYVAAATTVTEDVPEGALCIGRSKQTVKANWVSKRGLLNKKKK